MLRKPLIRLFIYTLILPGLAACGPGARSGSNAPDMAAASPTVTAPPDAAGSPPAARTTAEVTPPNEAAPQAEDAEAGCTTGELPLAEEEARASLGPAAGIQPSPAGGPPLTIAAILLDEDCQPVAGARMNVWQTDGAGVYGPGHGTEQLQCCYYMGAVTSDGNGRFDLITVRPGTYQGETAPPPAHIHIEVVYPGLNGWATEIVFLDDPYLTDPDNPGLVPIALEEQAGAAGPAYSGMAEIRLPIKAGAPEGPASTTQARIYTILPGESSASYQIEENFADITSLVRATGVTGQVEGEIVLGSDLAPVPGGVRVRVDLRALRTNDPQRDEKLADRWLVTKAYPYATFTSTQLSGFPAGYEAGQTAHFTLSGELTIRDVTKPVTFEVQATLAAGTLTGQAEATIRMTDFGIEPPNLLGFVTVEDEVRLQVTLVAEEGPPGGKAPG